jgi:glycosyltransferase involved in cell wall biosynthesis
VADWLVRRRGFHVHFYCNTAISREFWPESVGRGLEVASFTVGGVAKEPAVPWRKALERGLCYAYGCHELLEARRPRPIDAVVGRSDGLGSTLYASVTLPRVPIVQFLEYYYHPTRHDLADELVATMPPAYVHWRRAANVVDLLDLENRVLPWAPTAWQRDLYPPEYRDDFFVLHDGVDSRRFAPRLEKPRSIAGRSIPPDVKILTFVARGLDRLRGFDRFLKLANAVMKVRSDVVALVVGEPMVGRTLDLVFYGKDHRAHALQQDPPTDPDRLWFLGGVTPTVLADVLAASDLHVAPGRTYAPARSLLEAMAAGRVILASDTPPHRELIRPGVDGLLADPADPDAWVERALEVLDDPEGHRPLGKSARDVVLEHYAQDATLPKLAERLNTLAGVRD